MDKRIYTSALKTEIIEKDDFFNRSAVLLWKKKLFCNTYVFSALLYLSKM